MAESQLDDFKDDLGTFLKHCLAIQREYCDEAGKRKTSSSKNLRNYVKCFELSRPEDFEFHLRTFQNLFDMRHEAIMSNLDNEQWILEDFMIYYNSDITNTMAIPITETYKQAMFLQKRAQKLEDSGKRVVNEESIDYPEVLRLDLCLLFLHLQLNKEDAVKIRDTVNKLKEHI